MDLKNIKKVLTKILVILPDSFRARIGEDKLLHGFVGLYIQQWGKWFGPVGATIMYFVAVFCSFFREKLSPNPDYGDVKWTAIICFIDLFLFILLSMLLDVVLGIQLRMV